MYFKGKAPASAKAVKLKGRGGHKGNEHCWGSILIKCSVQSKEALYFTALFTCSVQSKEVLYFTALFYV